MKEEKLSSTEFRTLRNLNKKQKVGAVLSAVYLYYAYMEFTVDVNNTDSFEVAIDEYFFNNSVDVNIVQSHKAN